MVHAGLFAVLHTNSTVEYQQEPVTGNLKEGRTGPVAPKIREKDTPPHPQHTPSSPELQNVGPPLPRNSIFCPFIACVSALQWESRGEVRSRPQKIFNALALKMWVFDLSFFSQVKLHRCVAHAGFFDWSKFLIDVGIFLISQ
ncbi:hypothetical protein Fcan01_03675 [Folsomia candida]|uniref:Uncharacterized protein n=1 Tax=Folsomia candida TaxID=158441 RepID=A0A226EYU8_FOLCA|nr:hypothetical protein Fcan01_03675 [Folsomia candida]